VIVKLGFEGISVTRNAFLMQIEKSTDENRAELGYLLIAGFVLITSVCG
jgi:hypothetical protein